MRMTPNPPPSMLLIHKKKVFRIVARALDPGGKLAQAFAFIGRQLEARGLRVFFEVTAGFHARDRHDVAALLQEPGQGNLRGPRLPARGDFFQFSRQGEILLKLAGLETGQNSHCNRAR